MMFINCPKCGHKLVEGEEGSSVQVKCNKCGSIRRAVLKEGEVMLIIKNQDKGEKKAIS